MIGNRECPVLIAAVTRSATVSSASSASIFCRGVINSSAERSPNRSDLSTSTAVTGSSAPLRAELRTSDTSSRGERADRSSSAGSMPSRRRIRLAVPLVSRISGVNSAENNSCGPADQRAVDTGRATARFFGTSSPKTIDSEVAIAMANTSANPPENRAATPIASRPGWMSLATTGSARKPVTSVVIEMPTCAPDSWNDNVRWARRTSLVAPVPAARVGVHGAAFERGQRELRGDEDRGARGQQRQMPGGTAATSRRSSGPPRTSAGPAPGRLEEGSASAGSRSGRSSRKAPLKPGPRRVPAARDPFHVENVKKTHGNG